MKLIWLHRSHGEAFRAIEAFIAGKIWGRGRELSGDTAAVFVDEQGQMTAAVIFHNWDREAGTVELTGASVSPRFLTRQTLRDLYSYAFDQLGCQAVMQTTRADDERQARLLPRYGFTRHVVPRLMGRDTDAAIYVLREEDWRASRFNKELQHG